MNVGDVQDRASTDIDPRETVMKVGDVVEFKKGSPPRPIGRICRRQGVGLWWVNFPPPIGCMPVDEINLTLSAGDAPECTGCPD